MAAVGKHHVIIGGGISGSQAADTLRTLDPDSRITLITLSRLPVYNRYDLPQVFRGRQDWRDFLVQPPEYYRRSRISLRRATRVANVDATRRIITLAHNEELRYDTLLVASGGRGYLPEELAEFLPLLDSFTSFEDAVTVRRRLPEGGHVIMIGGDMIGLDLARTMVETGHRVTLVAGPQTFWPHRLEAGERKQFLAVLAKMGMQVVESEAHGNIETIEPGAKGMPARRIVFGDNTDLRADSIMAFCGLVPSVEFMLGSGVDIERGLLVSRSLRTTNEAIYAAGDVCQIWDQDEKRYRFYYGWKNVRAMGELAARNIVGGDEPWSSNQDESLRVQENGSLYSPFWEYA